MKVLLIILFAVIYGCNNNGENKSEPGGDATTNSSISNKKDTTQNNVLGEKGVNKDEKNDSTIFISFPKDSTWVTVEGKMKGISHPVSVYIPVKQGKQLTATVVPEDPAANVRINQVFTPDGKADGPFGRELKRKLHQQGTYKLIIGEDMMQGDEWKGKFALTIRVE